MASELDKTLSKLGITLKAREMPATPGCGFSLERRYWRVVLERKVRGQEKPMRFALTMLGPQEPNVAQVAMALRSDVEASELSLWDFAQLYTNGKTEESAELHKACKRVAPRVAKFFGDGWAKVIAQLPRAA